MKLVITNIFKYGLVLLALIGVYGMFFESENVNQFIGSFIIVIINSLGAIITHYSTLENKE
jgi:hypothetical protein